MLFAFLYAISPATFFKFYPNIIEFFLPTGWGHTRTSFCPKDKCKKVYGIFWNSQL